ncbi:MAG: four helix bundle protein [Candidatus Roizmanbacteria bacterium]|nr:four helix bundle protein [Candidatus Roizmanbacteria bacterium]MCR4313524.1 four helix bundle protein [Candidatus Roizmanbacteria bacterium]
MGGYKSLIVYWLATDIYDLTVIFCNRHIDKKSRTTDQMIQAARSGKQNIVEGSLEPSVESNIKLTGIARASFGELLEDYKDYLRQNNLPIWSKDDNRVWKIRKMRIFPNESNKSNETNSSYSSYLNNAKSFANLMVTLCFKEGYLLDKLLISQQEKFIKKGGFWENLFKKRIEFKNRF